jgi:hypothetical protein
MRMSTTKLFAISGLFVSIDKNLLLAIFYFIEEPYCRLDREPAGSGAVRLSSSVGSTMQRKDHPPFSRQKVALSWGC